MQTRRSLNGSHSGEDPSPPCLSRHNTFSMRPCVCRSHAHATTCNMGSIVVIAVCRGCCWGICRKYEEIYAPPVDEFVYISDNTYTREEVR